MHTWIARSSFRSKDPGSKLRGTQRVFSRMSDLDGPGFYREVERRYPHLQSRVVFLTGDVLSPEAQAFFAHVDRPHLVKPCRVQKVRQVIQQVLAAQ